MTSLMASTSVGGFARAARGTSAGGRRGNTNIHNLDVTKAPRLRCTATALGRGRGRVVDVVQPVHHCAGGRRRRGTRLTMQAFFGGDSWKDEDPLAATGGKTRAPLPFPQAISVGLSCAVDGSKAALGRPSDAWKPLTAATVIISVALDGVGFYAASQFLRPGDDAGMIVTVFSKVALVAVDGAWVFVAPLLAIAIVQQVLPLLGEKILFDALKASAGMGVEDEVEEEEEGRKLSGGEEGDGGGGEAEVGAAAATWSSSSSSSSDGEAAESASSSSSSSSSSSPRTARVRQLEDSGGLGLRGLGVAASKAQSLGGLGAAAVPVGLGLSFFIPVFGPIAATALATAVAAYTLAWELLDPYFDKAGLGFEQQEKVVWSNRFALTAFAFPFAAALAVPLVGPLSVAVAQGAAAELVWRVLEADPEEELAAER